ncbi:hypothetical protein BDV12DRAFT_47360 [Aspergillus spectabilis]
MGCYYSTFQQSKIPVDPCRSNSRYAPSSTQLKALISPKEVDALMCCRPSCI